MRQREKPMIMMKVWPTFDYKSWKFRQCWLHQFWVREVWAKVLATCIWESLPDTGQKAWSKIIQSVFLILFLDGAAPILEKIYYFYFNRILVSTSSRNQNPINLRQLKYLEWAANFSQKNFFFYFHFFNFECYE